MRADIGKSYETVSRGFWAVGLMAATLVVALPFIAARESDEAARLREQQLVQNGLSAFVIETSHQGLADTGWDDAVVNIDNDFDPGWAAEMYAVHFHETFGVDDALIFDSSDRLIFAASNGEPIAIDPDAALVVAARPLLARIRPLEYSREELARRAASGLTMSDPLHLESVERIAGNVYILSVQLVQPDFGTAALKGDQAPVVVAARKLDADALQAITTQFMLAETELLPGRADRRWGVAAASLTDEQGEPILTLQWTPSKPGTRLLVQTLPPTLLVLCGLCLFSWMIRRANLRMTRNLLASEARTSHLAYHDALTGLPNRLLFKERLNEALGRLRRTGTPFTVHLIDLDRFKEVNDTYGHGTGDDVIMRLSRIISDLCEDGDTVARLGGDEFAILQTCAGEPRAAALATRVIDAAAAPLELAACRIFLGASAGLRVVTSGEITAQDCLRQADLALYASKEAGRGRFAIFAPIMDETLRQKNILRDDLREAMASGALELVYQPQVHAGRIEAAEALLRWTHRARGPVSPSQFIPIAEESGLIDPLGVFVLRRAMQDSLTLAGLIIAVNVSAVQLRLASFVSTLEALINETGANPARFELEITEGLLLGDEPAIHERLTAIRALGFRISLDDFGTGFSSLSYLQRYPIDKIKIDRSFVNTLGAGNESAAVVAAIVSLARALSLDVVAEGVENETQRTQLLAAGCTKFQGYLLGRPVPLAELMSHLAQTGVREARVA